MRTVSRVAVLCDIHGNLSALDAVLTDVRRADVERIVVGGDVLPGPMARETLDRLLSIEVPVDFLYGNGEVAVLDALAGRDPRVGESYQALIAWNARQVAVYRELLASWPMTVELNVEGIGQTLFCHATPRNEDEVFTRLTPDDRLLPIFSGLGASVVICGHTHMQFDRTVGGTRVVNAGSVGMPFGAVGADWLLIAGGLHLQRTAYDTNSAAVQIAATECPQAEQLFARTLLNPPAESDMLAAYARAERGP